MTAAHAIAELVPFYATGTLDAASRQQVEEHLKGCRSCRELLSQARAFHRVASAGHEPGLNDHVQGQLLVEFHETQQALDPEVIAGIRAHLGNCKLCSGALAILDELPDMVRSPDTEARPRDHPLSTPQTTASASLQGAESIWKGWVTALLRPIPALAFAVLLLVLVVPAYLILQRSSGGGAASSADFALISWPGEVNGAGVLPEAIALSGETVFRQLPGQDGASAIELRFDGKSRFLLLELAPDIDPEDLADPRAHFQLEIRQENQILLQRTVPASGFDDRGRLQLVLDTQRLKSAETYTLVMRYHKAGDPLDGEALFRRSIRLHQVD
jgi:hypothetical protein